MKIIYHPSYDNGYYVNLHENTSSILGTKIVGTCGLLENLTLHNGLSGHFASDGERASAYLSHVSKNATGSMIETSFKNDALGVTKCLLGWRDKLIMAGWRPNQSGDTSTPKLQLLSQIEESWQAQQKGAADRWQELYMLMQHQALLANDDSIECRCAKATLPRLVQEVLTACKASFTEYPEDVSMPKTAKVNVLHYNDLSDAYRQVAAHAEDYQDAVVINRDNVSLNHILFSWGRPLVDATIQESNALTLQLFKLAMSVFSRPLNVQNLLSYLQLPVGPVPRKLRSTLANILTENGGFGEIDWDSLDENKAENERKATELKEAGITTQWELAIYNYINKEESETKQQRQSKASLLRYITDTEISEGQSIPVDTLKRYIGEISKWASAIAFAEEEGVNEQLTSQLATVVSYFKQLSDALAGTEDISYYELEKHVRTIYQPTSIRQAHAQVGAIHVVGSYDQLVDVPQQLIWLDCCGADQMTDSFEFLSSAERTWLDGQSNITLPRLQYILEMNRKEMIVTLSKIPGEITLVASDYFHNQKMAEHHLIAELKMQRGEALVIEEGKTELPQSGSEDIKTLQPKLQYELGPINYAGRSESNTSIDMLINYPFDYTMQYVARLRETSKKELSSMNVIIGLVAHSFIQNLVASVAELPKTERLLKMRLMLDSEYDARLQNAISTTGLSLLLKENKVDLDNVHFQLKRSVDVLITIMEEKKLTPVGCELRYEKPLDEEAIRAFNARIDMELEDDQQRAVIFDFKWSSSAFYGKKIEEGKSVQLELYRQELLAQGKHVNAVGYYLLPQYVLETSDFETLKDADGRVIIRHIEPKSSVNLFEQIKNSVVQRQSEIRNGLIEEGELHDIIDLPYAQRIEDGDNLLPVGNKSKAPKSDPNKKSKVKKDSNMVFTNQPESRFYRRYEFKDNTKSPNEISTTYPLMKGRLK